jgi:hypothetical protein
VTAVGALDIDVAEVGVGRAVSHHARKPRLLTGRRIEANGSELTIERSTTSRGMPVDQ